jgi:pyruvate/2-oxoglutarate dehydrogenase complex dihydrolipoamide dehydrogenase (E3) component
MPHETHDLIVVGAGQAGGPLAGAFAKAGRRVALVEREHVGGTCVNEGCTPTKTMVASARVAHLARRAADYGVEVGPVTLDLETVRRRKGAVVDAFRSGSENGLAKAGVDLVMGEGRFVGPRTIRVEGPGAARELRAPLVVLNTGLVTTIPRLPGLESVRYLTSTSIMELDQVPEHLVVLGGGYIGLEFAQMFRRFGSRVTIIQRDDQLMPREDADIAEAVLQILREDGCTVHLAAEATRVTSRGEGFVLTARVDGNEQQVAGSHLLIAIGRRPDTRPLDPGAAGIRLDRRGFIKVNSRRATSADGVYAMGDVTGAPAFTHIAYDDYRILRATLLEGGRASRRGRIVPYALFTDPQLGRVGITEKAAMAQQIPHRVATLPMTRVARALETDETRGLMKAVVHAETERILGAAILGTEGGEVATVLQVAMMGKLRWTQLRDVAISHPTWSESLNNLFMTL